MERESTRALFGMGCFWGAERRFRETRGVVSTAVGDRGGGAADPTYREVCSGTTGHAEVVLVEFDPLRLSGPHLLKVFWENHDPTQGMRQGADIGTQDWLAIFTFDDRQAALARASRLRLPEEPHRSRPRPDHRREIAPAPPFYRAEEYHQQYLEKNPNGYCGLGGTGVSCPSGFRLLDSGVSE